MAFEPPPTHAMQASGSRPACAEDLHARLVADHRLEVAHHGRVGVRPQRRAEQVVGVRDVGHPVADRLVDGVLQGACAAVDRAHLRTEQLHAEDVRLLAGDVDAAHVDDARQPQERGRGGRCDAVLPRAGLGDDPPLAHLAGEQRLAQRVVDLVRAGMRQVLPLEVDLRAAQVGRQPPRMGQRRGPADIGAQQIAQLGLKCGIGAQGKIGRLQLSQRRHQRLRHELAAVGAEFGREVWCVVRGAWCVFRIPYSVLRIR